MSQDSDVTYHVVERACKELLQRHVKPSRPTVQELLATDEYLGHKGSNLVVQKFVNEFWVAVTALVTAPPREIEGLPSEYVSVIDKALFEMVAISREAAAKELASEREVLKAREAATSAAVQEARDAAAAADQLRMRAEGERNALEQRLRELAVELAQFKTDVQAAHERESRLTADVRERDVQIKHLDAAIAAHQLEAQAAQLQHEADARHLLLQVDEARQGALREAAAAKALNSRIAGLEQELAMARAQVAALNDHAAVQRTEIAEKVAEIADKSKVLVAKEAEIATLSQVVLKMETQIDAAHQQRLAAEERLSAQTEQFGRLRGQIEAFEKMRFFSTEPKEQH